MRFDKLPVSIYSGLNAKCEGFTTFAEILRRMTSGELAPLSAKLAAALADGKDQYKKVKELECPAFIVGRFPRKENEACEEYCPVLVFDIDGCRDEFETLLHRQDLEKSPYVLAAFPSVSGLGLRIMMPTNAKPETHKAAYEAGCAYLSKLLDISTDKERRKAVKAAQDAGATLPEGPVIDTGTNNLARIWFYGHVEAKDLFLNEAARVFTVEAPQQVQEERPQTPNTPPPAPRNQPAYESVRVITEREKIDLALDKVNRQQGQAMNGNRNNWLFAFACELCRFGIPQGAALAECEAYIAPDFDEAEIKKTVSSAYQSKRFAEFSDRQIMAYARKLDGSSPAIVNGSAQAGRIEDAPAPVMGTGSDLEAAHIEEPPAPEPEPPLYLGENCYLWRETGKGKREERISNFGITPRYLLLDNSDPKRVWSLTNMQGETIEICFPSRFLSSPKDFCALVEGKGNFVASWSLKQLAAIKEHIFPQERKAEEISTLGYQPETGHYAFAQGVFDGKKYVAADEYGIAQVGGRLYYLPAFSKVNELAEREYHNERKFLFQPGKADFATWSKQLLTVFGDNATIGICFAVAALFRDVVFAHANAFPILFLFGPRGTGKTTYRLALKKLFGNYGPNDAIGLGSQSSPKGFARKLAQIRNGLEAFEEYKNRINAALIEMLKNVYDGIGYERAQTTNDNRTHATPVNSAVIVAGQEMPTKENALFSRVLLLSFGSTTHSEQAKREFHALEALIEEGLGNVLLEIIVHRRTVAAQFEKTFSEVYGHLRKDHKTNSLDERALTNVAVLLAPMKILADALSFPFSYAEAYKAFRTRLLSQNEQMAQSSEVVQFWRIIGALIDNTQLRANHDYKISEGKISIYMESVFKPYYKHCTETGVTPLDQTTLESYLTMQPYFRRPENEPGRIKTKVRMDNGVQKRCLVFDDNFTESEFLKNTGNNG